MFNKILLENFKSACKLLKVSAFITDKDHTVVDFFQKQLLKIDEDIKLAKTSAIYSTMCFIFFPEK